VPPGIAPASRNPRTLCAPDCSVAWELGRHASDTSTGPVRGGDSRARRADFTVTSPYCKYYTPEGG